MRILLPACVLLAVAALGLGLARSGGPALAAQSAKPSTILANAPLEAGELADFLGISSWAFAYEGGVPECWLEVQEEGQQTVKNAKLLGIKEPNQSREAMRGKILLFLRPGNLELRINSGASSGGAGVTLPPDALWWAWKGRAGSSQRLERPVAPKPGQDVTLMNITMDEDKAVAKDPKKPRRVQLVLKARLAA
ncbi:MAG: hypothetical protein U0790_13805 [Isosphaeraceae bacterium]